MPPKPTSACVTIQFTSYWSPGSGDAGGADVDRAILISTQTGLPYIGGRQLKGHLRESAERLARCGRLGRDELNCLFGSEGAAPAALRFGSAHPSRALIEAVRADQGLAHEVVTRIPSVRVDQETGVALDQHLRWAEAAIPMILTGEIFCIGEVPDNWVTILDDCAAITLACGGMKNDGYGAALIWIKQGLLSEGGKT